MSAVLVGLLIPFLGTSLGAACVFFLKKDLKISVQRALTGFAAGVMVAASIWSLIVPAIEQCEGKGPVGLPPRLHRILVRSSLPAASGRGHPAFRFFPVSWGKHMEVKQL